MGRTCYGAALVGESDGRGGVQERATIDEAESR